METIEINNETFINRSKYEVNLDNQGQVPDLKIISQNYNQNTGQTYLVVSSNILMKDNYKLFIRENHLGIVISEHIEFNRPVYLHHYNLKSYQQQSYERLHSASVLLPGHNYHLINHFFNPDNNSLEIVLGHSSVN